MHVNSELSLQRYGVIMCLLCHSLVIRNIFFYTNLVMFLMLHMNHVFVSAMFLLACMTPCW